MNCRVRYYQSFEEAVSEWRRLQVPNLVSTPVELLGTVVSFIEGASDQELERIKRLVAESGGRAFRCDTSITRLIIAGPPGLYWDLREDDLGSALYESIGNSTFPPKPISLPSGQLGFNRTLVMGILNTTPDSFSDGGRFLKKEDAVKRALEMVDEGADIIDVGGESTRPFAEPVSKEVELERVIPVLREIAPSIDVPISIDTMKFEVAREALDAGAQIINDVSGLQDEGLTRLAAERKVPVILMHIRGNPQTMQTDVRYDDVIGDIGLYFQERLERAISLGIEKESIILDPGIGFGKRVEDNLSIIRRLKEFKSFGRPLMVGPSRKRFIGKILDESDLLQGTMAAVVTSIVNGANIVRVHDVRDAVMTVKMTNSILNGR